jgi:hypothetical protein
MLNLRKNAFPFHSKLKFECKIVGELLYLKNINLKKQSLLLTEVTVNREKNVFFCVSFLIA